MMILYSFILIKLLEEDDMWHQRRSDIRGHKEEPFDDRRDGRVRSSCQRVGTMHMY